VVKVHGPLVGLGWVNNEMEFLNPLFTYPDAAHEAEIRPLLVSVLFPHIVPAKL
jgi:hypothetical protein